MSTISKNYINITDNYIKISADKEDIDKLSEAIKNCQKVFQN